MIKREDVEFEQKCSTLNMIGNLCTMSFWIAFWSWRPEVFSYRLNLSYRRCNNFILRPKLHI